MNFGVIFSFVFSSGFIFVNGLTSVHNKSVFIRDGIHNYCDMSCGPNVKHTLCEPVSAQQLI